MANFGKKKNKEMKYEVILMFLPFLFPFVTYFYSLFRIDKVGSFSYLTYFVPAIFYTIVFGVLIHIISRVRKQFKKKLLILCVISIGLIFVVVLEIISHNYKEDNIKANNEELDIEFVVDNMSRYERDVSINVNSGSEILNYLFLLEAQLFIVTMVAVFIHYWLTIKEENPKIEKKQTLSDREAKI